MQTQKQRQEPLQQQQNYINYDREGVSNAHYRQVKSRQQQSNNQNNYSRQNLYENQISRPRQENKYITSHTYQYSLKKVNKNKNPLVNQNEQLKMKNQALKKELFTFSKRLDAEISRRSQKTHIKNQLLSNMELQNAYRRCEIYKKQLSIYKKKNLSYSQDKYNQAKGQLIEKIKQNQQLKDEVKQLRRIGKFQEKGLIQLGSSSYITTASENQRLKNENIKMRMKLEENQRNNRLVPLQEKNQKNKKHKKQAESINYASQQERNQQKQLTILKSAHDKDSMKLRQLTFEKNRQLEIVENLTAKLQSKDKQIEGLKGTIANLRKINKQSTKQKRHNTEASIQPSQMKLNTSYSKRSKFIIKKELKRSNNKKQQQSGLSIQESVDEKQNFDNSQQIKNDIFLTENIENKPNKPKSKQHYQQIKYPRLEEYGKRKQNSQQWNDHAYNSKIKEIQILPHENGHIKDIHTRYQNGEPNKKKGQYSSFVCQQFNQYITHIRGGFKDEILQFLVVETNQKRVNKFCRYDIEDECQNFIIKIASNEYPSALFGEKINEGIVRLGCFIERQAKK